MSSETPFTENEQLVLKVLHKSDGSTDEAISAESGLDLKTLDETLNHLQHLHGVTNKDHLWFLPKKENQSNSDDAPDKGLLRNGLHFLRWQVRGVAVKLALGLLMARWLQVEHFGLYSLIYTSAFLLATLSALGNPLGTGTLIPQPPITFSSFGKILVKAFAAPVVVGTID